MTAKSRKAAGWIGAGALARLGWAVGGWLATALGALLLAAWFWITRQLGQAGVPDPVWLALVLLVLLVGAVLALLSYAGELTRLATTRARSGVREWLTPALPAGDPESWGSTYVWTDPAGTVRYDGSSGDLDDLAKRLRAPVTDPRHALFGKVGPGWECLVRIEDDRDTAYSIEARRIARRMGGPGYENRRLEGRGA